MKKFISAVCGVLIGLINGTVGAGGGMVAVPMINRLGTPQKKSHSTAVAVLLPISAVSAYLYIRAGSVQPSDAYPFILPSVCGALIGTVLLKKIPTALLKKIFAAIMIYAGVRLFIK